MTIHMEEKAALVTGAGSSAKSKQRKCNQYFFYRCGKTDSQYVRLFCQQSCDERPDKIMGKGDGKSRCSF